MKYWVSNPIWYIKILYSNKKEIICKNNKSTSHIEKIPGAISFTTYILRKWFFCMVYVYVNYNSSAFWLILMWYPYHVEFLPK